MLKHSVMLVGAMFAGLLFHVEGAAAEDDAAITACETVAKTTLLSPKSYQRDDAEILGNKVYLTFDSANYYNTLLPGSYSCEYDLDVNGKFTMTTKLERITTSLQDLKVEESKLLIIIKDTSGKAYDISYSQAIQRANEINTEVNKLKGQMSAAILDDLPKLKALKKIDTYPIEPKNTKLKPM